MTAPTIESNPILFAERALIRGTALSALASEQCAYSELFVPIISPFVKIEMETGAVRIVGANGATRYGVTPAMLVAEVRAKYDNGKDRGRYFTK